MYIVSSHNCFVYYEVGTQWDTMDIFLFEISAWLGTFPFILVPVTRSIGGLLHIRESRNMEPCTTPAPLRCQ